MNKKYINAVSIIELLLVIVMYFAIDYHFDHDRLIYIMLASTNISATLLRLSIYIIPGFHLIASTFGLTFYTKGILCFGGAVEIAAGIITLIYQGESLFMLTIGIVSIMLGTIQIALTLLQKESAL